MTTAVPHSLLHPDARAALAPLRNLLNNARFWINRRGYVNGTAGFANTFTRDRWRTTNTGDSATFTARSDGFIEMLCSASGMEQPVEAQFVLPGVYVLTWEGTATGWANGVQVQKGVPFEKATAGTLLIRFRGGTVCKPQLEAGPVATPFNMLTLQAFQIDDAACRRYYRTLLTIVQSPVAGYTRYSVNFDQPMFGIATVSTFTTAETQELNATWVEGGMVDQSNGGYAINFTAAGGYMLRRGVTFTSEIPVGT